LFIYNYTIIIFLGRHWITWCTRRARWSTTQRPTWSQGRHRSTWISRNSGWPRRYRSKRWNI